MYNDGNKLIDRIDAHARRVARQALTDLATIEGPQDLITGVEEGMEAFESFLDVLPARLVDITDWGEVIHDLVETNHPAVTDACLRVELENRAQKTFHRLCAGLHRYSRPRTAFSSAVRESRLGIGLVKVSFTTWNREADGRGAYAATLNYENTTLKVSCVIEPPERVETRDDH